MILRTQCGNCGDHFLAKYEIVGGDLCNKCKPADLAQPVASAERISSVVRSGATTEEQIARVLHERDYLIEQLYKIYQHEDWKKMPDVVKEAVIYGLEKVSIRENK